MSIHSSMSNEELVTAIQQEDSAAFEFLFNQYYSPLVGYIITFTKNRQQSEDIVQHSYITLWQKRNRLLKDTSPKNYLYTIAINHYIDLYRKTVRENYFLMELQRENLHNRIEEDYEVFDKRIAKLKKIIAQLPPRCKEILYLSRQRGLEYVEIAEQLNISPRTVEEQIRIALKKIRAGFCR
ncbi:MAG: RNA polymerase sigma-70 factor [Cellulophaga sp.]